MADGNYFGKRKQSKPMLSSFESLRCKWRIVTLGTAVSTFVFMLWWYHGNKVTQGSSGHYSLDENSSGDRKNKLENIPESLKRPGIYPFNKILVEPGSLPDKLLFAAIISSASTTLKSRKRRDAIRKTWGNCHSEKLHEQLLGRNYYNYRKSKEDSGIINYKHCRILFYVGKLVTRRRMMKLGEKHLFIKT